MSIILYHCPFGSLSWLPAALGRLNKSLFFVDYADVIDFDSERFSLRDGASFSNSRVGATFLRYPYDLLPEFSGSFQSREALEAYKSFCLLFRDKAVNPIEATWLLRNRLFSLTQLRSYEISVPEFRIFKTGSSDFGAHFDFVKAIGNCFVSEQAEKKPWLVIARDGSDIATIMPGQKMNEDLKKRFIDWSGSLFSQKFVHAHTELRVYYVFGEIFALVRDDLEVDDRSAAGYKSVVSSSVLGREVEKVRSFCAGHGLGFCCFDCLIDPGGKIWFIDVNPYGSLPDYKLFPTVGGALVDGLASRNANGISS